MASSSSHTQLPGIDTSDSVESPTSVPHLPSFHVSLHPQTPSQEQSSVRRKGNSRARNESRKLFAHVLGQLERRPMPPPAFDAFASTEDNPSDNGIGVIVETVKGAVKWKNKKRERKPHIPTGVTEEESDDDDERGFSTNTTYDLMLQLKDVLIMSVSQGWHIFDEGPSLEKGDSRKPSSPFRRPRNSLQPGGRHSRSRSPSPAHGQQIQAPDLLSSCISVLSSVILEDCRYSISPPRPSRPPNALQALSLDIAQFLLHTHRHDPKVISCIGLAVIPAFSTFQPEMLIRLLTFFEGVMRGILLDLGQIQGIDALTAQDQNSETVQQSDRDSNGSLVVSIRVDEASENPSSGSTALRWTPWSPLHSSASSKLQSANAPLQSISVYYLSSLVPPLLAAVLECIDLSRSDTRIEILHRVYKLLHLIINTKIDSYTDILQVAGYHTPKARRSAVNLLLSFWPKAVGHLTTSRPFPIAYYPIEANVQLHPSGARTHPHDHQFTPWHFNPKPDRPSLYGSSHYDCRSCSNPINGFGLLCPFCMCAVHFDCYDYPEGSHLIQYSLASDPNVQRVAVYRFSSILYAQRDIGLQLIRKNEHLFRLVNLFTLCLCFICRRPLWGCTMQALNCLSCMHFIHDSCLSSALDLPPCSSTKINSNNMDIDWTDLRSSCIDFHNGILRLSKEELGQLGYEDISIVYAQMHIQLQIITNGVAMGSIVVSQNGKNAAHAKEHRVDEFELHHVIRWCETYLSSDKLQCSDLMDDYIHENRLSRSKHTMMFDLSNLVYICTAIKSQHTLEQVPHSFSSDLLNVHQTNVSANHPHNISSQPFEVVSLAHMRDVLGQDFNIHSDIAARHLLSHLNHIGLFERLDREPTLFTDDKKAKDIFCVFPLPLGLDLSINVETLASAVEACLSDLDLSVNEVGFLLLVRRLWPNGLASDYALRRLIRMVVTWVLAEDNNLAVILRDYLAKQRDLPGVRKDHESFPWPSVQSSRPTPSSSVNNGGDYIATRRALLTRYTTPWLLALHDQDPVVYAGLVYDICVDIEDSSLHGDIFSTHLEERERRQLASKHDGVIRSIIRLSQSSIVFTVLDQLFVLWLEAISTLEIYEEPMPSLSRIFPRDGDTSYRYSMTSDFAPIPRENIGSTVLDPWHLVIRVSAEGPEGLLRSLQWLCLFARSGVEIAVPIFLRFSTLVNENDSSLSDSLLLVKAVMCSTWLRSVGRQELQIVFAELHARLAPRILNRLIYEDKNFGGTPFIQASLGTCLLLYGCDRKKILELQIIKEQDIEGLPSRRKTNTRGSVVVDPIIIDSRLMNALETYIAVNDDEVSCLIAKFLNLFLNDSPYLEPYEVDNFILRNGKFLAACAWQFYGIQHHEISSIRTTFLLRTLVVDSQPFQDVLHTSFQSGNGWELRLLCVTRLFRIMLDVISPSFNVEGRQWKSSVTDIFYYFFTTIWADEREEVRIAADAFASTLLPAHFDAISLCWDEFLTKAPITERAKLISFLMQLHPRFPSWKVLSWDTIVETLLQDDYEQKNTGDENDPAAAHLILYDILSTDKINQSSPDTDMVMLRVSILLLSLQMIADGITIDSFTLLKIKVHLVQAIGFSDILVVPSPNGHSFHVQFGEVKEVSELGFPCIRGLLSVFDAHHHIDLAPSAMAGANEDDEKPSSLLVGSIFVDVSLAIFCTVRDLSTLPVLTLKSMLETLCVIIYKHDFESRVLRHLQQTLRRAVLRALDILSEDSISHELRQLALSATQAFIKRWYNFMGSIIYISIESAAKLVASQHHGQDALTTQAKSFLDTTLITYVQNGLFTNLLKRQLDRDFFVVLKQVADTSARNSSTGSSEGLRELLLRDALLRAVDNDQSVFQVVLGNIETFVEVVFYDGYSLDLILFVGQQLTHLSRRASDLAIDNIDPSPFFTIPAMLIQHNKTYYREILPYIDTIVRVVLIRQRVTTASLLKLVQATTSMHRGFRLNESTPPINNIISLIFEILSDGLRTKNRVLPSTLKSMLEVIMGTDTLGSPQPIIKYLPSPLDILDSGLYFLQNHAWIDVSSESDFTASLAVGKMILQLAGQDPSLWNKLSSYSAEKSAHTNLGVRAWNIITLATLLESKEYLYTMLFAQLHGFSDTYHALLRIYAQSGTSPSDSSTTDINHAYIGIKLWVMLAQKVSTTKNTGDLTSFTVWNELWPPFESLVDVFEVEARAGMSTTLGMLISSSIADLFIFLRALRTPVALHTSSHISTLNRLRGLGRGEASMKLTRALRCMSESPPEISFDVLVNQTAKDIVAAEKLRVLESKAAQERRGVPERHRNMRTTS